MNKSLELHMKLVVYQALVNEEKKLIKDFNVYKCNLPFSILDFFEEEFRLGMYLKLSSFLYQN